MTDPEFESYLLEGETQITADERDRRLTLNELLSPWERSYVMTTEEYRTNRLNVCRKRARELGLDDDLSEQELIEKSMEDFVREFWESPSRSENDIWEGSLEGLSEEAEFVFRPILIVGEDSAGDFVDRETGVIPLPEEISARIEVTKQLVGATTLQSGLNSIQAAEIASLRTRLKNIDSADVVAALKVSDSEAERMIQIWTQLIMDVEIEEAGASAVSLEDVIEIRGTGARFDGVQTHHPIPVHRGSRKVPGDNIQLPIPTQMHLMSHLTYMHNALNLVRRLEHKQGDLNTTEQSLLRLAKDEYIQNAASASLLQNVAELRRHWHNDALSLKFNQIMNEGAVDELPLKTQTLLRNISLGIRDLEIEPLTSNEIVNLNSLLPVNFNPQYEDIILGKVDQRPQTIAIWLALHPFQRLVESGRVSRRESFADMSEESRVGYFEQFDIDSLVDSEDDDEDYAMDHLAQQIAFIYLQQLYSENQELMEAHQTMLPPESRTELTEAEDIAVNEIEGEEIFVRRFFSFGARDVVGLNGSGKTVRELLVTAFSEEDWDEPLLNLAEHAYKLGYEKRRTFSELVNLEGDYHRYEVPGISDAADIVCRLLDSGKKMGITPDGDVDGVSFALILATMYQAETGRMPEITPGVKKDGHSVRFSDLERLARDSELGLIVVGDRGSGPKDIEVMRAFLGEGYKEPHKLLTYLEEYKTELSEEQYERVSGFIDYISRLYGWRFTSDGDLDRDLEELRRDLDGRITDSVWREVESSFRMDMCRMEEVLKKPGITNSVRRDINLFIKNAQIEHSWELGDPLSRSEYRRDILGESLDLLRKEYGWSFEFSEDYSVEKRVGRKFLSREDGTLFNEIQLFLDSNYENEAFDHLANYWETAISNGTISVDSEDGIHWLMTYLDDNRTYLVKSGQDVVVKEVENFIEHMFEKYSWSLDTNTGYQERLDEFVGQNYNLPGLTSFVYGCGRTDLQILIMDHHEVSAEAESFFRENRDRVSVVNPKWNGYDESLRFPYVYSGGLLAWQLNNAISRNHPWYRKTFPEKQSVFNGINRTLVPIVIDLIEKSEGIRISVDVERDYDFNSIRNIICDGLNGSSTQEKTSNGYVKRKFDRAIEIAVEEGLMSPSEARFYNSYNQAGRFAYDYVKHTAYWAALSVTADVIPVNINPQDGGNVWTRALYTWALDVAENESKKVIHVGDEEYTLNNLPGYVRLKTAVAKSMHKQSSTLYWPQARAASHWIAAMINGAILRDGDRETLDDFYKFAMHRSETSGVKRIRDRIAQKRRVSFQIADALKRESIGSFESHGLKDLNEGVFMVADITKMEELASSRTGIAAQELMEFGNRMRPALVFSESNGGNFNVRASIRVPGGDVNAAKIIEELIGKGLITSGGGHAHACGFTAKRRSLPEIVTAFNKAFRGYVPTVDDVVVIPLTSDNPGLILGGEPEDELITNVNLFNLGREFVYAIQPTLEPISPRIDFLMNVQIESLTPRAKMKKRHEDDADTYYSTVVLIDENGHRYRTRIFDESIDMLEEYSNEIGRNYIFQVQVNWVQIKTPLPAGVQKMSRKTPDGDELTVEQVRAEHARPRLTIGKIVNVVKREI